MRTHGCLIANAGCSFQIDHLLSGSFDEIIVNGWETETALVSVRDIGAGKKKKDATKAGFANMAMYE